MIRKTFPRRMMTGVRHGATRLGPVDSGPGTGAGVSGIAGWLSRAAAIRGAVDVSLVDYTTGRVLGAVDGRNGDASRVDADAPALIDAALLAIAYAPGATSNRIEDVILTTTDLHHLIRPIRTGSDPRVVLYLRLNRTEGNLALARRSLRELADDLG